MHFIALHTHGSSNPVGISGNVDRIPMHGYFIFKDLITVFVFILIFSLFIFYSPNTLGQWPTICAICLKYLTLKYCYTNIISGLYYASPLLVKINNILYNKQITYNSFTYLKGISETKRTHNLYTFKYIKAIFKPYLNNTNQLLFKRYLHINNTLENKPNYNIIKNNNNNLKDIQFNQ
jgi:hypothetical protein